MSSEDESGSSSGSSSSEEEIIEFDNDEGDLSSGLDEDDEDFDVSNFKGRYCAEEFETDLKWDSRDELVEWVKRIGKDLMMCLVVKRSNYRHVSLTCERYGVQRMRKKCIINSFEDEEDGKVVVSSSGTHSKKKGCTFELIGVPEKKNKYQSADRKWILRILSGVHNHKLPPHFEGHGIIGRLTDTEKALVRNLGEIFTKPIGICKSLKVTFPGNVTSPKHVSNYLYKMQFEDRGDLSVSQWTLHFLKQRKYFVVPMRHIRTREVGILFFGHPESMKLLKRFPYVIVIDATYKTNKYKMAVVEIVGFTCTHKTFNIGFAFTKHEDEFHYTFIMKKLRLMCEEVGVMPTAIVTDREQSLINALHVVFPEVQHLLCWVHIKHNIFAYAGPIVKNSKTAKTFSSRCWGVFLSTTEETYEERLATLRRRWGSGLVGYVEKQWLNPYKENIVSAWTDHKLHFFTRTSNRVEGIHKDLKKILDSSVGGFNRCVVRIHSAIESQICKVKASMEMSRLKVPTCFNEMEPVHRKFFSKLFYVVSDRCLVKLHAIFAQLVSRNYDEECNDYWMRECLGLPCLHEVAQAIIQKKPLKPSDIHRFWKQIEWKRIIADGTNDIVDPDEVIMTPQQLMCIEFSQRLQKGELRETTIETIGDVYTDLEHPRQSTMEEPTSGKEKGRPRGALGAKFKSGAERDPSRFEYVRDELDRVEKAKKTGKTKVGKGRSRSRKEQEDRVYDEPYDPSMFVQPPEPFFAHPYHPVFAHPVPAYVDPVQGYMPPESDFAYPHHLVFVHPVPAYVDPGQGYMHMGMDFGIRNIDLFWYPFIQDVRDVVGDEHCGYRSLCVLMGQSEGNYACLRSTLASHLVDNRELYEPVLKIVNPGKTFERYAAGVNYTMSPCPERFWCDMPMVGLAFATLYRVAVAFLSWDGPCLCLPMRTSQSSFDGDGLQIITMALVGNRNHFIPVWLKSGSPLPPTPFAWRECKDFTVFGWDAAYASRMNMFRELRMDFGRLPDTLA